MATVERSNKGEVDESKAQDILEQLRAEERRIVNAHRASYGSPPISTGKSNSFVSVQEKTAALNQDFKSEAENIAKQVAAIHSANVNLIRSLGIKREK